MTKKRKKHQEKLLLLYDGECKLCLAAVGKLRQLKPGAELTMLPFQSAPPDRLLPGTTPERMAAELHLVDESGRVYRGAASVVRIMRTMPALAWLTPLYRVPGLHVLADAAYKLVAKHRYRLFGRVRDTACSSDVCKAPKRT